MVFELILEVVVLAPLCLLDERHHVREVVRQPRVLHVDAVRGMHLVSDETSEGQFYGACRAVAAELFDVALLVSSEWGERCVRLAKLNTAAAAAAAAGLVALLVLAPPHLRW